MNVLKYLASLITRILTLFAFGWIASLRALWRALSQIFTRWRYRQSLKGRAGRASDAACNPINEPSFNRPDPLIYAQYDLLARGYAVTWDNPDIELRKSGVAVSSSLIDPDTEYEIVARVWNSSPNAVVVGLPVVFSYLSFGVGVKINPIAATSIPRLGVKGGPDHPAFTSVIWKTPPTPGHYCLLVFLEPADDTNFNNNLGQENVNVGKVASPATFAFQLRNQDRFEQAFRFEVDTYSIPALPLCGQQTTQSPTVNRSPPLAGATPPTVPAAHSRANYPVPPGWLVEINPNLPHLLPEAETTINVRITPPPGFTGRQPFNVNAFDSQALAGGVTLYVEAP